MKFQLAKLVLLLYILDVKKEHRSKGNKVSSIFLDIEGTIFESFDKPFRTNFARNIFKFVAERKNKSDSKIFIFSWAIHNEEDAKKFLTSGMCLDIEAELSLFIFNFTITLDMIITKESLRPSFRKKIAFLDLNDFHDLCNDKEIAFELFSRFDSRADENENVLIDDTVVNKEVSFDNGKIIRFICANNFGEQQ